MSHRGETDLGRSRTSRWWITDAGAGAHESQEKGKGLAM